MTASVAALFVDPRGPYWGREDVDAWDEARDAREYCGPLPVVAHPPCGRWCRLAKLVESRYPSLKVGNDGGCFAHALRCVEDYGGVLEHPAWSLAWAEHELTAPNCGGWTKTWTGTNTECWVCEVNQAAYGHEATKATWLLYVGRNPPVPMNWERTKGSKVVGHCKKRGGGSVFRAHGRNTISSDTHLTPLTFADALISLARNSGGAS